MSAYRHAYLVFSHQNPAQLERLLRLLDDPSNDIYLHIDPLSRGYNRPRLQASVQTGNLFLFSLQHLGWGSETLIDGIVALLREAVKTDHLYYHLLSGLDLPLQSQAKIHRFFEKNAGLEFVDFGSENIPKSLLADRLQTYHLVQNYREIHPIFKPVDRFLLKVQQKAGVNRLKNVDLPFQKGSLWFSITHEFACYCVEQAARIRPHFRYSKCGDELFFQTLLLNSPFLERRAVQTYNDNRATMRFIDWDRGNGSSPYVFRADDFDEIMESGMLFARKFDEQIDATIIDRITSHVLSE